MTGIRRPSEADLARITTDKAGLISRLLDVVEHEIVPLTRAGVGEGNKIFGGAVLRKSDLSTVVAVTNQESANPLNHGEIATINAFYAIPRGERPAARDTVFLSTHEPCPLCLGGLTWGGGTPAGVAMLTVQLVVLALATGGVFAGMILGHWYLVTPKLPEAPLVAVSRRLLAIVVLQVVLFVLWVGIGVGPGSTGEPFGALFGEWALFVWLRLLVGLSFPLVVSWAALQTAKTRSMESATGLLYINVGTIAAGTILAAGLYFGAGLLV
jgi:hypothetical protein